MSRQETLNKIIDLLLHNTLKQIPKQENVWSLIYLLVIFLLTKWLYISHFHVMRKSILIYCFVKCFMENISSTSSGSFENIIGRILL